MEGDMQALRERTKDDNASVRGLDSAIDGSTSVAMAADSGSLSEPSGDELVSERYRIERAGSSADSQTETDVCCGVTNVIAAGSVVQ